MGVTYRFVTMIGFEIPLSFFISEEKRSVMEGRACGHPVTTDAKFCPECGVQRPRIVEKMVRCRRERGPFTLPAGVSLELYAETCWPQAGLAGWILSDLSRESDFHKRSEVPPFDREALAQCLTERGVPFDPESWGVHAIVEAS